MPGHDQTLYAKWIMNGYRVYFNLNGHGAPTPASMIVEYGGKIPTPTQPSDKAWTFGGWFTDAACSPGAEWNFAVSTMPANDLNLYAKWTAKSDASGGDNDKDKDKESDKDSGKDKGKDNVGSDSGSGSGAGGSSSDAEGGGEATIDDAIEGIVNDDTYGEAGADNMGGEDSEWRTSGGSAAAGEEGRGSQEETMSFANIILMIAGILIAVRVATRRKNYPKWAPPAILSLGAFGVVLYFVIEDIHSVWTLINSHTIYFAIILAAQIAAVIIARRSEMDSGINPE
jgi:uncharacterized repeat protein (TIGR02543 family)